MKKIMFTKPKVLNNVKYVIGDVIQVGSQLAQSLINDDVAKDYIPKKKKAK